MFFILQVMRN